MLAAHFLNVAVDINLNDSRMKPVKIEKRMRIDGAMSVFVPSQWFPSTTMR